MPLEATCFVQIGQIYLPIRFQNVALALEHPDRFPRCRRAAELARRRGGAAPYAQRGQPADSRARRAAWLRSFRAAGPPGRAQPGRGGTLAQRAERARATRRWRACDRPPRQRRRSAETGDGSTLLPPTLVVGARCA